MNWGNKLLLAFLVFGGGMIYLVVRSVKTNYELVEKDYYKSEIAYQQVIDGTNRANQLNSSVRLEQTATGILLSLPDEMRNEVISGNVWFYCSYDAKKDRKFSLGPDKEGKQLFSPVDIPAGNYTVKISWNKGGKNYFTEKMLTIV
ncbi:MAG: hypothetical protein HOP10_02865 [Chitinophagaceae bacterium]|nr:hypothetical protein [Chitinophagaceae bacterium]